MLFREFQGGDGILSRQHSIPVLAQDTASQIEDLLLVLHEQNGFIAA